MSLFPAYANDSNDTCSEKIDQYEECCGESLALEAQLLASDNDEEHDGGSHTAPPAACQSLQLLDCDYYVDCKLDVGNLRVSTLYYPGRPQYSTLPPREALGGAGARAEPGRRRARRYYSAGAGSGASSADALPDEELAERTRAYRDMLADNPTDESLWLQFIEFQELTRGAEAGLAAAESAARATRSPRVRAALHRARALALSPLRRLDMLRRELALAESDDERTELWLRTLGCAGAAGGAELDAAARAALGACRASAAAYPLLLYAYGAGLRAAGHWERLVLLLELVLSMNFPPAAFPPPPDPMQLADQERRLHDLEDKVVCSGLPLSTVWVRVERARAAVHWRAVEAGAVPAEDPQRAPVPADVAHLLQPAGAAAPLLVLQALRLAKVPLLPLGQHVLCAADASGDALGDAAEADGAEVMLALVRAARRLPATHAARGPGAARLVQALVEPPHYLAAAGGFLRWVRALWDAACEWLTGEWREAMLCWRLRWLHALLLLLDLQDEAGRSEAQRIRNEARAAVKRWAASALPYAHVARLERRAAGPRPAARPRWPRCAPRWPTPRCRRTVGSTSPGAACRLRYSVPCNTNKTNF
ncbi:unnamed protein product [Spodoptera littoralis]|uniref:Protein NRDE2 homolog n=1 Tax=Spodoptera littoralis TaxID=7109 RepID=A0A9P0MYS8_SPOLI|nr:unnamed protein product [Spodoptera littoralis]CAH1636262.1 unnamed protein product [Spodoptera littoralis]